METELPGAQLYPRESCCRGRYDGQRRCFLPVHVSQHTQVGPLRNGVYSEGSPEFPLVTSPNDGELATSGRHIVLDCAVPVPDSLWGKMQAFRRKTSALAVGRKELLD